MTEKQIEQAKKEYYDKYYGDKFRIPENLLMPISKEDEVLYKELLCREMINSVYVYGGDVKNNSYILKYENTLGKQRVKELIEDQLKDLRKATIKYNVYTDCEGLSYHSIEWKDEK